MFYQSNYIIIQKLSFVKSVLITSLYFTILEISFCAGFIDTLCIIPQQKISEQNLPFDRPCSEISENKSSQLLFYIFDKIL